MKRKTFLALVMVLCLLMNFAWAECNHENVVHNYTEYHSDSTYHWSTSMCKCMDCGVTLACCPHPGTTPMTEHQYNILVSTSYVLENINKHTIVQTVRCECGHSITTTRYSKHDYKYVSDYHGTGLKHYINYRCSLCNQTKTTTYTCPGNPCYMPALYRQPIEEE